MALNQSKMFLMKSGLSDSIEKQSESQSTMFVLHNNLVSFCHTTRASLLAMVHINATIYFSDVLELRASIRYDT